MMVPSGRSRTSGIGTHGEADPTLDHAPSDTPDDDGTNDQSGGKVLVRIVGRADWYDRDFQSRSATRFPRYEVETVETLPRRGSIASFNQDDDETFGRAMAGGVALEVDAFRIDWIAVGSD